MGMWLGSNMKHKEATPHTQHVLKAVDCCDFAAGRVPMMPWSTWGCGWINLRHKEDTPAGYNIEQHLCSVILLLAVPMISVTPAAATSEQQGEWLMGNIHLKHTHSFPIMVS
jgi:hypothetical protein